MKQLLLLLNLLTIGSLTAQVQSPKEFYPTDYGQEFTPHHVLVNYFQYVAEKSPMVKLVQYGKTNQDRPLILAYISSAKNINRLEEIRKSNLALAGIDHMSNTLKEDIAIVWLSNSIHGNEAGGAEASASVLYELVSDQFPDNKAWLDNTVVIIDPSVNPDGYSRYTHWIRNVQSSNPNIDPMDIEHNEPWPGGRVNHYLFDLNRDWAWQTQVESQQRMKMYNQWLPHVLADLHEQGYNNPYYFAPAAKPYHSYISEWQRSFQEEIGNNHAKYFDQEGWLYFTKEIFDLFYPSYGDTYPTFQGAIGMTYEQAGHSMGGRAIETESHQVLTLQDRIDHHKTTSLSTIEMSSQNASRLVSQFKKFFEGSKNPVGEYKSYVIKNDQDQPEKLTHFMEMMDRQAIEYKMISTNKSINGYSYNENKTTKCNAVKGDIVVSTYQPKSILAQVLLDPVSELEDSLTYDITAWSLPIAYGLEAYGIKQKFEGDEEYQAEKRKISTIDESTYAIIIPWGGVNQAKMIAKLQKAKVNIRYAKEAMKQDEKIYPRGTVIVNRADNRLNLPDFHHQIAEIITPEDGLWETTTSGMTASGPNFGSEKWAISSQPKVLSIIGDGVGENAFGQVKFFMEKELEYPMTIIEKEKLSEAVLAKFNTLILPEGYYSFTDELISQISSWVEKGGKLILIGYANRIFADKEGFSLTSFATEDEKTEAEKKAEQIELEARYNRFHNQDRRSIANEVPGAIFELKMDTSHPLGFAMDETYFSLKTSSLAYPLLKDAWNVAYSESDSRVIGFVGSNAKKKLMNTVSYAHQEKGAGEVVYMIDNPLFRMFWQNGKQIFSNALFF